MTNDYDYEQLLTVSKRVNWRIEDIIGCGSRMDFSKPFLPETFARATALSFLTPGEQLTLNHIRAHGYLAMFELVERCILPYVDAHIPSSEGADRFRGPALAQFAAEEAKHIELFVRFRREFAEDFGDECAFIGPADEIGAAIRDHSALGLAIFVLGIEWVTQNHYLESVRDDQALDSQFKSLLKHHWIEESQHVKLDALLFFEMAGRSTTAQIDAAIDDFLHIGALVDSGLKQQAGFGLAALQSATGHILSEPQREQFLAQQHQAMRWTFLGSAMRNRGFLDAIGSVSPVARARIEQVAPAFC